MSNEPQTQQADDPSGDGWRDVRPDEILQPDDMTRFVTGSWLRTTVPGMLAREGGGGTYRRRIEPPLSDSERYQMLKIETLSDMVQRLIADRDEHKRKDADIEGLQERLNAALKSNDGLEHDIQRQYELLRAANERNEKLVRQVELTQQENGELQGLVSQAERGGQQVNAELQQLREQVRDLTRQTQVDALELQQLREQVTTLTQERDEHARKLGFARECAEMSRRQVQDEAGKIEQLKEQVATLTRERDRYRNQLAGAIEHSSAAAGQQQVLEELQKWLRPVLELVAEHPDDASPLAVAVLGYLPGIASRLIEE